MKGFIIRQPWANLIFEGKKIWEIRGHNTKNRGMVGLVCQGKWIGNIEIIDSVPLSLEDFLNNKEKHNVFHMDKLPYPKTYAWIIGRVESFEIPKKYTHKKGCVIWVNLIDEK